MYNTLLLHLSNLYESGLFILFSYNSRMQNIMAYAYWPCRSRYALDGYHLLLNIITDSEYQSIIKWGLNFYDVNITTGLSYIARKVDVLIALNDKNIYPNLSDLKQWYMIIAPRSGSNQ